MATTFSNHLNHLALKPDRLRRSLNVEYLKSRVSNFFLGLIKRKQIKSTKKLIDQMDESAKSLMAFYDKVNSIPPQDAKKIYPS